MKRLTPWLALLALLGWTQSGKAVEPIKPDQFSTLHQLIKPGEGEEKWQEIPWQTNLWEARRKAAEEGKPILLWEMDGHPLGCV